MRSPIDPNDVKSTPTSTEDSAERGLVHDKEALPDPESYRDLGQSETLDSDEAGDIADEGRGHRG